METNQHLLAARGGIDLILRGHLVSFAADPADLAGHLDQRDGAIAISQGRIAWCGAWDELQRALPDWRNVPVTDHRPSLILPGLIDAHLHFPQVQVIASWGAQLLDWLERYTFPEEARFADADHARVMAEAFCDLLLRHGTTAACVFGSVHPQATDALFAAAQARGMALAAGKVMMDSNAPEALRDTATTGYDESAALIARWHGKGRACYAISPRFALTSSPEQLDAAGALAAAHPDCLIQTHLSETTAEIARATALYPEACDYLDIYDRAGLLGPRSLMGHAIHLSAREIDRMAETKTRAIHCPSSNLFLGSGLFDHAGLSARGVVQGIASDIGAGTSYSMLQNLRDAYQISQLRGAPLTPFAAFHWATRANAEALGRGTEIGRIKAGWMADLVVLDPAATPAMALRAERAETLGELLFILQIMGDDRAVLRSYVAGRPHPSPD